MREGKKKLEWREKVRQDKSTFVFFLKKIQLLISGNRSTSIIWQ